MHAISDSTLTSSGKECSSCAMAQFPLRAMKRKKVVSIEFSSLLVIIRGVLSRGYLLD